MEILRDRPQDGHKTRHRFFYQVCYPALLVLILLTVVPARFAGQVQDEYDVKAAYLLNFPKFVEWPAIGEGAFGICIFGDDPFESTINRLIDGKTAFGRPIQIRRIKEAADAKSCHIAFVSAVERGKAAKLVEAVRGTPVLTVGETQEFLRTGGMVALSEEDSRVHIIINPAPAQSAGLKISAHLMTLAKIYKGN